jgi:glycyl-tRNA synthetase beta chain
VADFLFEIGLEEVPARMIAGAQAELLRRVTSMLCLQNLMPSSDVALAKSYSTPRRLAIYLPEVFERQADSFAKVVGPSAKIAYKDGQPTPAAEAFARKNGITLNDLKIESTDKGEYLVAETSIKGRAAAGVIAEQLPKEIAGIYWAKNMRWIPGSTEKFVRPVMWMVCLLGDAVVPVSFGGKTAGRASYGHRVLSSGEAFEVQSPESYLAQLEGEYVLADVEVRRQKIRKALDKVTREVAGARWREDEALVDAVTHLTEWPDVLLGNFDAEFLKLPEEVLVTVMRDHQKYFAVEDAQGKLAPHFLTVTNIALDAENAGIIRQGNERVLKARFNDARFFWEFDQRTRLVERVKLLENVTFQKDLGSYAKKSERVRGLAAELAGLATAKGAVVDGKALDEAATLAKTDLTTELVKEFTELQGVIGGLYAASQGVSKTAADAIYDQYLPASAKDAIPRGVEGAILGLADRVDTITGMFGLGLEPTGSKDPFALRRAANAVVRILAESPVPLLLSEVLAAASPKEDVADKLGAFFLERIDFYLREGRGQAYDVVKAVMAAGSNDLPDLVARAEAVTAVRGGEDFLAVSAAFKRMKNILQQPSAQEALATTVVPGRTVDPAHLELWAAFQSVRGTFASLAEERQYVAALETIATLRPQIDAFFEQVMVLDPDETVRASRVGLLAEIVDTFSAVGDFSEIVTVG